jgi:hypothetical protein
MICFSAKYPLATISRLLEVFGEDLLVGYDIGCSFGSTLASSSLGSQARDLKLRCCVNAFHGYSHNFACQSKNHPNIIEGIGLEDIEGMERIFSGSNQLASITRYSSAFRRRLFIDLYFRQWDEDRYLNLATWITNNYIQALNIISENEVVLEDTLHSLGIAGTAQLDEWQREQVQFFETLGVEPEWNVHAMAYVEHLQELHDLQ